MIREKRLIALTRKVLGINSENPPGNEFALSRFITRDMRAAGLSVKTYTYARKRPNVVAVLKGSWPRKRAACEAFLLTPHFDTVPIGQGWTTDPLGGRIVKGRIYGRGASDDKGNLACCMELMRSLTEDGFRPRRDIVMAATADEETGSHYGIVPLLEKGVLRPGAALIVDSEEFDTIVAQKGLIHCRIQIAGRKAHGAYNWRGVNAIETAARVIGRLKRLKFPHRSHPRLRGPTINIGVIRGGDKVNMVADFCEFAADIRFLPGMRARDVLGKVKEVIRTETRRFKVVIDDTQDPFEIDPRHPLVSAFVATGRRMRIRVRLKGSEGATVITFFQKYGIPAFSTGFGARGAMHTTDEYARVKDLVNGARLLERFVKDYDRAK